MKYLRLLKYDKDSLCGKIKETFFIEAINEYLKRLDKYTKIQIIEVNDVNLPDKN
jgi:23S rRNA (pseudouridine1915-N3)-methyltransferase